MMEALKLRRSVYKIGKDLPVDEAEVVRIVEEATRLVPDAFDMKSQRVVLALGDKHDRLWDAIYDAFGGKVAQMPFGGIVEPPAPKAAEDLAKRVRIER